MNFYGCYYAVRPVLSKANLILLDESYAHPSQAWVAGEFSRILRRNLAAVKLTKWKAGRRDCDKFARFAWAVMSLCHGRLEVDDGKGIAFGLLIYVKLDVGQHACNAHMLKSGELLFYEPQTQEYVELSDEERTSCTTFIM